MFELRRLRLLHELALRGTIAQVAASLSYSPSTVSQQLALLEKEAGVTLLEPDGRRVRLTPQGRMLAEHAARALELDEEARAALTAHAGWEPVRIAAMPTAAQSIAPAALSLLAERAPGLRVELAELPPEESLFELWARRFDLVIAGQYPCLLYTSDAADEPTGGDFGGRR
ncbi:LysR family transcriptional regulator, partial [Microbacterium sp. AR7-10]|uniref:LysR family transcriptional regulator n=1 Tax=Microbacterium sp. AR7-10 TaxID=1891970 RepID=UPI0011614230